MKCWGPRSAIGWAPDMIKDTGKHCRIKLTISERGVWSDSCNVSQGSWVRYPVWQHSFVSPSAFSRRTVVSYWRKYVHEVMVNRLGGLSLLRINDRPDMTLDVHHVRRTTIQQQQQWNVDAEGNKSWKKHEKMQITVYKLSVIVRALVLAVFYFVCLVNIVFIF